MTQIRPRLDPGLAAEVQAYADTYGISFTDAVKILLRNALKAAAQDGGSTP
jgi:antitoxin component of RelBE/YafQ-DinJ toxin-antitoxin module